MPFVAAVVVAFVATGCRPAPRAPLPGGFVVALRAGDACKLFRRIASAPGSVAAMTAAGAARAACACPAEGLVSAVATDGELATALQALRCGEEAGLAALAPRGDEVGRFALPGPGGARTTGIVRRDPPREGNDVVIALTPGRDSVARALLGAPVNARLAPGGLVHVGAVTSPATLAGLLHDPHAAHVLPGLDVAAATLLDGSWEVAVYAQGGVLAPVVRVGVRAPARVLDALTSDAESRWHLAPRDVVIAGRSGECVPDARMLPGLAPCAVVDGDALVVGFNQEAIQTALSAPATANAPGGIDAAHLGTPLPWSRIAVAPDAEAVTLRLEPRGAP